MLRTFDLAKQSFGNQSPNPNVGCVITHRDRIIGEGFHHRFGGNHAEINAINAVTDTLLLRDSSIFVSLEPCHHFGKTPPCVDTIIHNNIPSVFISIPDVNPKTANLSINKLRNANHRVVGDVLAKKGNELIKPFYTSISKKRPFVVLKYAVSNNNFIGLHQAPIWLSNPFSKRLVHLWRSKFDAILVGGNTVRTDNPRLTTRYFHKTNPLRVIITKTGNLPHQAHLFDNKSPTLVATTNHKLFIPAPGVSIWKYNPNDWSLQTFLTDLLEKQNIGTILIEGGAQTLQSFIDANLWDEIRLFRTPKNIVDGIPAPLLQNHELVESLDLGSDIVEKYRNRSQS